MTAKEGMSLDTRLVHAPGSEQQPAAVPAIHRATVWRVGPESLGSVDGEYEDLKYPRYNDGPNPIEVGAHLAALENGEKGMVAASGMAAITAALLSHLETGDHLLVSKDLYGGTYKLVTKRFPTLGIEHTLIDPNAPDTWTDALRENTRLIYETLVVSPPKSSHAMMSPEQRSHHGIADGLLRISVGIEDIADIIDDFRQALD